MCTLWGLPYILEAGGIDCLFNNCFVKFYETMCVSVLSKKMRLTCSPWGFCALKKKRFENH